MTALFAPWPFTFTVGPGWDQAALFAQLMVPAYSLAFVSGSIGMTLIVVGWHKTQLTWEITRPMVTAGLWVGSARLRWSVRTMIAGRSAIMALLAIAMIGLSGWAIRTSAGHVVPHPAPIGEATMGNVA